MAVCDTVGEKYGIPVVNKRIAVSPVAVVAAPFGPEEMVTVAQTLDRAARSVNVDFIGGFSALVEKGMARGDHALIDAVPDALASTERGMFVHQCGLHPAGINMDAILALGRQIKSAARLTADKDGLACAKLCIFANIPQDVPFMAGAYLGVGVSDAVINVGVSGPGVCEKGHRPCPGHRSRSRSAPDFRNHQAYGLQSHAGGRIDRP